MKSQKEREAESNAKELMRIKGLLATIENNTSVFKDIPDNIGKIEWCDSTNLNEAPKERSSNLMNYLSTKFFRGVDYFVGSEGFAEIHFEGSRENISKREVHRFDSFAEQISTRTRIRINYVDQGTPWYMRFFNHPDPRGVTDEPLEFIKDASKRDKDVIFLEFVEKAWSRYKVSRLMDTFNETGVIPFNQVVSIKGSTKWGILPYIKISINDESPSKSYFEVYDKRFDSSNLKNAHFDNNGRIILVKKSDNLLNKVGILKQDLIWYDNVGSPRAFDLFFNSVMADILHSKDYDLNKE